MLRRVASGGFVCLRCRLQQRAVVSNRPFSTALSARSERHTPQSHASHPATEDIPAFDDGQPSTRDTPPTDLVSSELLSRSASPLKPQWPNLGSGAELGSSGGSFGHNNADLAEDPFLKLSEGYSSNVGLTLNITREEVDSNDTTSSARSRERLYRSRGRHMQATDESLPINVLGKPGGAIVLRERRVLPRLPAQEGEETNDAEQVPSSDDILKMDAVGPSIAETLQNIDELRPGDAIISANAFKSLRKKLQKGFTSQQLSSYIQNYRSVSQQGKRGVRTASPPWVLEKHPWVPGAVAGRDEGDVFTRGYITKSMRPKEKLATCLVRECWGVSSQTVAGAPGRLDVKLNETEFNLLLLGPQSWLQDIARTSLGDGNRIEILRESNAISILASLPAAESVFDEISKILSKTKNAIIETSLISQEPLDPQLLQDIGRATNTLICPDPSGKQLHVSWVDWPEPAEGLEDRGEVVLRSLLGSLRPRPHTSSALAVLPPGLDSQGRYLLKHGVEPQLAWNERRKQWARWVAPVGAGAAEEAQYISPDFLPHPIGIKQHEPSREHQSRDIPPVPASSFPQDSWSSQLQTDTRAVYGHILHAPKQKLSNNITSSPAVLDTSAQRTFIPVLPPLTALDFPATLQEEGLGSTTTLVFRFHSDPHQSSPDTPQTPTLELRVEIYGEEVKRVVSLRAVTSSFVGDVIRPSAPVDLRLLQDRYLELSGSALDDHAPAILDFLSHSDLRPWEGEVATPPTIPGLRLPRRVLNADTGVETPAAAEAGDAIHGLVDVHYRLAAVEVQRTITAEWEGFQITYRSTEDSTYSDRSAEISLDAVAVGQTLALEGDVPSSEPRQDAQSFLASACKLAARVVSDASAFGWVDRR